MPDYGSADSGGSLTYGCLAPEAPDDVHLFQDLNALIQADAAPFPSGALLVSSLRPTVPFVLLNVSMGDRATVTDRRCGCPMEALGLEQAPAHHQELREADRRWHDLRRYRRRARAGGGPSAPLRRRPDRLPAHRGRGGGRSAETPPAGPPRVGSLDGAVVAEAFLEGIGVGSGAERIMALQWRQGRMLQVERGRLGPETWERSSTSGRPERRPGTRARPETAGRAGQDAARRRSISLARLRAVASAPPMSRGDRDDGGAARVSAIDLREHDRRGGLGVHDPVDRPGLVELPGLLHLLGEVGSEPREHDAPSGRLVELRARVVAAHGDDELVVVQPARDSGDDPAQTDVGPSADPAGDLPVPAVRKLTAGHHVERETRSPGRELDEGVHDQRDLPERVDPASERGEDLCPRLGSACPGCPTTYPVTPTLDAIFWSHGQRSSRSASSAGSTYT